ncbi:Aste57867_3420 [Aphanomyces stellatus]|uniref:Aste57867_3420 protein n=1 Tax=Aphanomyces stellatus TaxID=120398 RepID=A0A485KFE9_9STRA|nr:hypothetical protein As57867_003410 [Aphanomyces stellatus]VFT80586.1 Aste57867_3420 [Aphanomyces stellatus]
MAAPTLGDKGRGKYVAVFLQLGLMRTISAFQDGLYPDMQALADLEIPVAHTIECRARWSMALRDSSASTKMQAFGRAIQTWVCDHGSLRLAQLFACLPRLAPAVARQAVWTHDFKLVGSLHDLIDLRTLPDKLVDMAAQRNDFEMVTYLNVDIGHMGCTSDAMDWACEHGNLELVMYLHRHGRPVCTKNGLFQAVSKLHLDVATYVVEFVQGNDFQDAIDEAINTTVPRTGRLDVALHLISLGARLELYAMEAAAASGQLAMVQWIHANATGDRNDPDCLYAPVIYAAENGHLAVVEYLLDHFCATNGQLDIMYPNAMHAAAGAGHIEIVQAIHRYTNDTCSMTGAMDIAAANGHLEIVQRLHAHRPERGCSQRALDLAAANNHMDVVVWLHHQTIPFTTKAMDGAAKNGHLRMVQWLHAHASAGCTDQAMTEAAVNGHLSVVEWLHTHRNEGTCWYVLDITASNGHWDVVQWFHMNRPACLGSTQLLKLAAKSGHVKMIKWIVAHRIEGCPRCGRLAAEEYRYPVICHILQAVPRSKTRECPTCGTLTDALFYAEKINPRICQGHCRMK